MEAFVKAEKRAKPPISELFTDVYDEIPQQLEEQQKELLEHIAKYPNEYPTKDFATTLPKNPHSEHKKYI